MTVLSPAKINLHLRVGQPGADGFHPIMSWFCTVGLFDSIEISLPTDLGVSLACNWKEIPTDEKNLVMKAAKALLAVAREPRRRGSISGKRFPPGAGWGAEARMRRLRCGR